MGRNPSTDLLGQVFDVMADLGPEYHVAWIVSLVEALQQYYETPVHYSEALVSLLVKLVELDPLLDDSDELPAMFYIMRNTEGHCWGIDGR